MSPTIVIPPGFRACTEEVSDGRVHRAPSMHWSARYVGSRPLGAPACWRLVQRVYSNELGIDLPRAGAGLFEEVPTDEAREFDLVLFRLHGLDDHAGVVVEHGQILHAEDGRESRVESYQEGRLAIRDWRVVRYRGMPAVVASSPAWRDHVNVVAQPFLTEQGRQEILVLPGTTLAEIVVLALPGATEEQQQRADVWIGDTQVLPGLWAKVRPFPGAIVTVQAVPGALNLRTILSLVVVVAAIATGQIYGAALGIGAAGSAVLTAGVSIAGTLLINAFVPLRPANEKKARESLSINGWQNEARPDQPFPLMLGKRRSPPPYYGLPYMEIVGDDMYLRAGFIESLGIPIITEQKIGDTAIFKPASEWANPLVPEHHFEALEIETTGPGSPVPSLYDHQVVPTEGMGATLTAPNGNGVPVVRVSARDAEELEAIFALPRGLGTVDDEGKQKNLSVNVRLRYRLIGTVPWTTINLIYTSKRIGEPIFRSHRWKPATRGQYEIEGLRTDTETDELSNADQIDWVALYAHRPESPLTNRFAVTKTAIRVKATKQLNGTLDAYNRVASSVCADWNVGTGTWIIRETANPASLYRYFLQGPHLADPITDDRIKLDELQAWHVYCASKGLKFHREIDYEAPLTEVLADICAAGRATWRHDGVKWGVVVDRPRTVVSDHIGAHNCFGFTKSRKRRERIDGFLVGFADRTNGYNRAERLVPWPGFVGTPAVVEAIEIPWETDPARVWVETRRRQHEADLRTVSYQFGRDIEALGLARGSLALANHPKLTLNQCSARVLEVSGNVVELIEGSVTMEDGKSYVARFRRFASGDPDQGVSILRDVVTAPGEHTAIVLAGSGQLPEPDDLVLFGEATMESVEVVIRDIEFTEGFGAQIVAVPHAPELEALTDAEVAPPWDGRVGEITPPNLTAPLAPIIGEIRSGGQVDSGSVEVMVRPAVKSVTVASFDVEHRITGGATWTVVTITAGEGVAALPGYTLEQSIDIRARAKSLAGVNGAYSATSVHIVGVNDPTTIRKMITRAGQDTGLQLCLDPADLASYGGSGKTWADRSATATNFYRGTTSSSEAADPTFVGAAGGLSTGEYWALGGDQWFTPVSASNPTWLDAVHKDNAAFTFQVLVRFGSVGSAQGLIGNRKGVNSTIGFEFVLTAAGTLQFTVTSGTAVVLTQASSISAVAAGREYLLGIALNEAANTLIWQVNDVFDTDPATYTAASTASATVRAQIGARGDGFTPLNSGSRVRGILAWNRALTQSQMSAVRTQLLGRIPGI